MLTKFYFHFLPVFICFFLLSVQADAATIAIVCDLDDQQSDVAMIERLENVLGHTLTLFDEGENDPVDLTGQDVLIITSPISSGNVGGAYRDVDIPILFTERAIADDMNLSGAGGDLTSGVSDIEILNNEHPITQDLPLDFVFFQSADSTNSLIYVAPNGGDTNAPGMDILGVGLENPDYIFLLAADRGAELNNGQKAVNRRVFYGIPNDGFFFMSDESWQVFDRIIEWLTQTEQASFSLARSISNTVVSDSNQLVTITVTLLPNSPIAESVITETPPNGWSVSNIAASSGSASLDGGSIRWSVSGISTAQTLTYSVLASPDDITGSWSGGSLQGEFEIPVTGDSSVRISQGGQALVFQEENGLIVIEAEHFRTSTVDVIDSSYRWVLGSSGDVMTEPGIDLGISGNQFSGDYVHGNVRPRTDRAAPNDDSLAELSYRVNVTNGGTFYLWLNEIDTAAGSSNTTYTNIDDRSRPDALRIGSGDAFWRWDNGKGDAVVSYDITPGIHDLFIWLGETGIAIDKIILTTDANFNPSGLGPNESNTITETSIGQWSLFE